MGWIADHGLIKIADADLDLALGAGDRSEISNMAIATDPNWRTCGQFSRAGAIRRILPYCRGRRHAPTGHFEVASRL